MEQKEFHKRISAYLKIKSVQLAIFVFGLFLVLGAVSVVRVILEKITNYHWSMGLFTAVLTLGLLVWMLSWIEKAPYTPDYFGFHPRIGLTLNLILVVLTAIVAMSFISNILYEFEIASYKSDDPVTAPRLLDYYSWHFIDSIPFVDIWGIFKIESRIEESNTQARALLEFFHVLIVATVIRTFLGKKGRFGRLLQVSKTYRSNGEYSKAENVMTIAMRIALDADNMTWVADANIEYAKIYKDSDPKKMESYLNTAEEYIRRAEDAADLNLRKSEIKSMSLELSEDRIK